jgi:hypothetical protein
LNDIQWLSNEEVVAARLGMLKSPEAAYGCNCAGS